MNITVLPLCRLLSGVGSGDISLPGEMWGRRWSTAEVEDLVLSVLLHRPIGAIIVDSGAQSIVDGCERLTLLSGVFLAQPDRRAISVPTSVSDMVLTGLDTEAPRVMSEPVGHSALDLPLSACFYTVPFMDWQRGVDKAGPNVDKTGVLLHAEAAVKALHEFCLPVIELGPGVDAGQVRYRANLIRR